jgi:AraC-like DNA-binding protein
MGRVGQLTMDRFAAAHPRQLPCGGELGEASGKTRPKDVLRSADPGFQQPSSSIRRSFELTPLPRQAVSDDLTFQDPELLRRLLRAKDRLDAASHEEWPVQRLAQVSDVSKAHFARSFKQAFGVPPHRYQLTRRIERATALLRETDWSITEIAFATGWQSLGTFGRTFRDVTGESPSAIRASADAVSNEYGHVPVCFVKAAERPNLTIAVSEKRRLELVAINESLQPKEVP